MEGGVAREEDIMSPKESKLDASSSKKRKLVQRAVVRVRVEGKVGKQKGEGPPSDSWSWRKYGQKPIKGSPYPRGYYRCSTSKGCSAKKQVERCRNDASMLIITYTSNHNHPGPDLTTINQNSTPIQTQNPKQDAPKPTSSKDEASLLQSAHEESSMSSTTAASKITEENDFFDELEELNITSSPFTSFVRASCFFDDKIPLLPSYIN